MTSLATLEPLSKPLKRSPMGSLNDLWCVQLGHVLELETNKALLRWDDNTVLLWCASRKSLMWAEQYSLANTAEQAPSSDLDMYEEWSYGPPKDVYSMSVGLPKTSSWESFGPARRIDYASDRTGKMVEYTHKFDRGVRLYRFGARDSFIWVAKGGKMHVTRRGIEK